jgi:hypothetical protein
MRSLKKLGAGGRARRGRRGVVRTRTNKRRRRRRRRRRSA